MGSANRVIGEVTEKQLAILAFMRKTIMETHVSPSTREIADHFGIASPNGVACHIQPLMKQKLLTQVGGVGKARCYVPTDMREKVQILTTEKIAVFRMGDKIGVMIADSNGKIIHSGLHTGTEIVGFAKKMKSEIVGCTLETAKLAAQAYAAKLQATPA